MTPRTRAWAEVAVGVVFEVAATATLPATDAFTRIGPSVVVLLGYGIAFFLLTRALRALEVGVMYAVWSGAGTAAVAVIGITLLNESLSLPKALGLILIVAGVIALHLDSGWSAPAAASDVEAV